MRVATKLFNGQLLALGALVAAHGGRAELFQLPTANHAIYEPGKEEHYFVGTVGKPWMSGTFGCVRTDGWQLHEGLDIRCLQRDKRGEPIDPVMAAADGTVAYINTRPSLSNYGNYIIVRHQIEGMEIYTLYAHLSAVRAGLRAGQTVKAGEAIATMGHTSNTRQRITLDRAHVHFEINLLVSDRYAAWHNAFLKGERNDHGDWNGKTLAGIDPRQVLIQQHKEGEKFSLVRFLQNQPELCRVMVRDTHFGWLKRYAPLIRSNEKAAKEGTAGFELSLNFNGVPCGLTPRAASELRYKDKIHLLSVNEMEQQKNPCGRIVVKKNGRWELTNHGTELMSLLTY